MMSPEERNEALGWVITFVLTVLIGSLWGAKDAQWPILYFLLSIMGRTRNRK